MKAYADCFVAYWRRASAAIHSAGDGPDARKLEERMERLGERTGREPALELALDRKVPERQHRIKN